ncbi:hypothetical protein ON010_g13959 [Phytophthora cinnamomi]|nr:hypothetical protein ON010_g13959 [Phytophthora cinnamomi]
MAGGDLRSFLSRRQHQVCAARDDFARRGFCRQKVYLASQVASALGFLHAQGLVHGALRSQNVLLDGKLNAKLTGFQGSTIQPAVDRRRPSQDATTTSQVPPKLLTGSVPIGVTDRLRRERTRLGALWSAPEVLRGERSNAQTDIFSFGVVLSELDSLAVPYGHSGRFGERGDSAELLEKVAAGHVRVHFASSGRARHGRRSSSSPAEVDVRLTAAVVRAGQGVRGAGRCNSKSGPSSLFRGVDLADRRLAIATVGLSSSRRLISPNISTIPTLAEQFTFRSASILECGFDISRLKSICWRVFIIPLPSISAWHGLRCPPAHRRRRAADLGSHAGAASAAGRRLGGLQPAVSDPHRAGGAGSAARAAVAAVPPPSTPPQELRELPGVRHAAHHRGPWGLSLGPRRGVPHGPHGVLLVLQGPRQLHQERLAQRQRPHAQLRSQRLQHTQPHGLRRRGLCAGHDPAGRDLPRAAPRLGAGHAAPGRGQDRLRARAGRERHAPALALPVRGRGDRGQEAHAARQGRARLPRAQDLRARDPAHGVARAPQRRQVLGRGLGPKPPLAVLRRRVSGQRGSRLLPAPEPQEEAADGAAGVVVVVEPS